MNTDRRSATRFQMNLPMTVRISDQQFQVFTTDVSAKGVAFEVDTGLKAEDIELEITFPPEVTLSASLTVRCDARVVRIHHPNPSHTEVAASISRYEFLETQRD
jgi:hypothetical protein